jgi:DNA-binding transcriptional MerR regulator
MLDNGFIKIHRSILKWEWYSDANTKILFLHLILTVNYYDEKWRGTIIKRGQRISSYSKLSEETGLSIKNIRTALNHLKSTGEVAHESTSTYGLFTVVNYDKYQEVADESAHEGQSMGSQGAVKGQLIKNTKKAKNEKESKKFIAPTLEEVQEYCKERNNSVDPKKFYDYFDASGWIDSKGNSVRNWKQKIITWESNSNGKLEKRSRDTDGTWEPKYGEVYG